MTAGLKDIFSFPCPCGKCGQPRPPPFPFFFPGFVLGGPGPCSFFPLPGQLSCPPAQRVFLVVSYPKVFPFTASPSFPSRHLDPFSRLASDDLAVFFDRHPKHPRTPPQTAFLLRRPCSSQTPLEAFSPPVALLPEPFSFFTNWAPFAPPSPPDPCGVRFFYSASRCFHVGWSTEGLLFPRQALLCLTHALGETRTYFHRFRVPPLSPQRHKPFGFSFGGASRR